MLEALEGPQPAGDGAERVRRAMRLTGQDHRQRRRERVGNVVVADEPQIAA